MILDGVCSAQMEEILERSRGENVQPWRLGNWRYIYVGVGEGLQMCVEL